jgi:hypothetical protein
MPCLRQDERGAFAMPDAKTLYDEDFVAWSKQQAAALRNAARSGANLPIDWKNLAEEVEDLGISERRTLHSQIQRIIRHLVKLQYSPATEPRRGWEDSITDARREIELVLRISPSLKRELGDVIADETGHGSQDALADLRRHGELDPQAVDRIRAIAYSEEQILGDWFPPEPKA